MLSGLQALTNDHAGETGTGHSCNIYQPHISGTSSDNFCLSSEFPISLNLRIFHGSDQDRMYAEQLFASRK